MVRLRLPVLFVSILGAVALGSYGSAAASDSSGERVSASDSPLISPCDIGAGPRFRCGRITVPAVRGEPSLGDQSIFFAVRPRDQAKKSAIGTIFAVEGGPGYASSNFDSAKSYRAVFGPLLRRRDLVLVDQRGTGHSQAVDCAQLQRGMVPEVVATGTCANQLGARYQGFTSAESAADIEAVRNALGVGPITLYGDSYGTLLAQAYSVRYPASLRSMVLSSAYPANDPFWRTIYTWAMRAVKLSCARNSACRARAASLCGAKELRCSWDAEERFKRALARIQRTGGPLNGTLAFLLEAGTWSPNSYLALNRAVTEYLAGDPDRLDRIAREGRPGDGDFHYFSTGMGTAVECNDYPVAWNRSADFDAAHGPTRPGDRRIPEAPAVCAPHGGPVDDPPVDGLHRMSLLAGADIPDAATRAFRFDPAFEPPGPGALRRVRRHHHCQRGPLGCPPVPVGPGSHRPEPGPRLGSLLPVPLAGRPLDPALRRRPLNRAPRPADTGAQCAGCA